MTKKFPHCGHKQRPCRCLTMVLSLHTWLGITSTRYAKAAILNTVCLPSCRVSLGLCFLPVHSVEERLARHLKLHQQLLEARAGDKVVEHQAMAALPAAVKQDSQYFIYHSLQVAHGFWLTLMEHRPLAFTLVILSHLIRHHDLISSHKCVLVELQGLSRCVITHPQLPKSIMD